MKKAILLLTAVIFTAGVFFAGRFCCVSNRGRSKEYAEKAWTSDDELNYIDKLLAKGLTASAAEEMEKYINEYKGTRKELANACYRLGSLYMELYKYEKALKYFYRAEMLAKNADFSGDMNNKIVEALDDLGMKSQADYELNARASLNKPVSGKVRVVASIGRRKIDENEIDRAINNLPDSLRSQLKKKSNREYFIKQYVTTEALYDKAKREGIDKLPDVRESIEEAKKQIVIQNMIEKKVAKKLIISPSDVKLYYEANKDKYVEGARAKVRYLEISKKENKSQAFNDLKAGKGKSQWVYEENYYISGVGEAKDIVKKLLKVKKGNTLGPVKIKDKLYAFIVDKNEPRRYKTFDEVKDQAEYEYKMKKRKEIVNSIIKNIIKDENVKIFNEHILGKKGSA